MTCIRKIRKQEYKMKRFIAAHRFENVPYLWREFLYFVFIDTTGAMSESNNVKKNGKESTVIYLFIFCSFFPVVYKRVPPPLATASFSIPDLFSVAHDRGREKLWGSMEQGVS